MEGNKCLIIFGIMLLFLFSGCTTLLKLGGAERKSLHYGYGGEGEFFYLQYHDRDNLRFHKLAENIGALTGKDEIWSYGSSKREVLSTGGKPISIKSYQGNDGYDYEEWQYEFYILIFKNEKLTEIKSTGKNKDKEYIWLETWYAK